MGRVGGGVISWIGRPCGIRNLVAGVPWDWDTDGKGREESQKRGENSTEMMKGIIKNT